MEGAERKIGDFLRELSEDPEALREYQQDPEAALRRSGLSERKQQTLRSNNLRQIRKAVEEEYPGSEVLMMIGIQVG